MAKSYVNRELRNGDAAEIARIVRDCAPFIVTPSDIKDGQEYDIELLRKASLNSNVELKALLDNNIFTRIIPLINGEYAGKPLDKSQIDACAIMCFLIYTGIEANPVTALWERPTSSSYTSNEEDLFFRIADHLHPQVFAGLALGRIQSIDKDVLEQARRAVVNNSRTMEDVRKSNFENVPTENYKLIYMGLLKVWLINKTEESKDQKLNSLLDWMYNQTISCLEVIGFALNLFVDNRSGGVFKQINSPKFDMVCINAKNAAWDILQIFELIRGHRITNQNIIYFFASLDKNLLKLPERIMELYNDNADLKCFLNSLYPNFGYEGFKKSMDRFNTRPDKDKHIEKVVSSLDNNIEELEKQVRDMLTVASTEYKIGDKE